MADDAITAVPASNQRAWLKVGAWPIRYKLLGMAMATGGLSLGILSAAFLFYHTYVARIHIERELTSAAEIVGSNSAAALMFGDRATGQELLGALSARPEIVGARIQGSDGQTFATIGNPDLKDVAGDPGNFLTVSVPVVNKTERIGEIRLLANLNRLTEERHAFAVVAVFAALAAALVGFMLSSLLQSIIIQPLNLLARVMGDVSRKKDYSLRVSDTSKDEFGILIGGFNSMLGDIERQHVELERYRTTLEQKVEERTVELRATNRQLRETIDQLDTSRRQAEAASKAKSDFLANMSHELRTPLNAIIGFSDILKSELFGPLGHSKYTSYADDIHFSGNHLLEIINDILDVVRQESGKMILDESHVDVSEVVEEAVRLVTPQATRGGLILFTNVPALPLLHCDKVRLRQMLLNLLSNAIKFTLTGGRVTVEAKIDQGLHIVVKDTGIGIRPEDMSRILTPFGQVASVYTRNHQGAGLGLTLTRALIEQHGGKLTLSSMPNEGTSVALAFPEARLVSLSRHPLASVRETAA